MKFLPHDATNRLGKLIPRLASSHDGEIIATVAAIGRTLRAAGADWHDLATGLALMVDPFERIAPTEPVAPHPFRAAPEPKKASKPKPEPSLWPTFSTMTHFGRCQLLRSYAATGTFSLMDEEKRSAFEALRTKITQRPHEILTRKEMRQFNEVSAALWAIQHNTRKAA